ncbi:MAG: phosphorothioated DNA-binding restriction endonuclease [Pseudomonadota bacterium]
MKAEELLRRIDNLSVYRSGERRAPHKPLLLLFALGRLQQGKFDIPFAEVVENLRPLLDAYAPPVAARHQPELPYWHLQSDALWELDNATNLPLQKGGFPRTAGLRQTTGHLPAAVATTLTTNPALLAQVVAHLLTAHFPDSLHDEILDATGVVLPDAINYVSPPSYAGPQKRDPEFRRNVLRAYEHRCAVTGFRAALGGSYFGCEAAHVQWHAYQGPDTVDNGIALEPTLHKLLDAGAWSLTDDRRIIVSAEFTGSDSATTRLRSMHGKPITEPLPGYEPVSREYIKWHRERELGGVFREPALQL